MKFGSFPIDTAVGLVLAHSVRSATILKKGHVVSVADIDMLRSSGIHVVSGAMLEMDDVVEDVAAANVAAALTGSYVQKSESRTGRCNIKAIAKGIVVLQREMIEAANMVDQAITIATVPNYSQVVPDQIIATVKVIPFAVPQNVVARIGARLGAQALRVAPFHPKKFAIVSTLLPHLKASVLASSEDVTRQRVAKVGGSVIRSSNIAHVEQAIAAELAACLAAGCDIVLVIGASATADRADVVPAGIVAAGGKIEHFGMPVDPGNLLLLAHMGNVPVIVMPGCARSPKLNGVDWVMQRLACDIHLCGTDIMGMGVGGLLTEAATRPLPRAKAVEPR